MENAGRKRTGSSVGISRGSPHSSTGSITLNGSNNNNNINNNNNNNNNNSPKNSPVRGSPIRGSPNSSSSSSLSVGVQTPHSRIPIIALSAYVTTTDKDHILSLIHLLIYLFIFFSNLSLLTVVTLSICGRGCVCYQAY